MSHLHRTAARAAAVITCFVAATAAHAETAALGKASELWRSQAYTLNSGTPATIYEVPKGRRLVVTDIVVPNGYSTQASFEMKSVPSNIVEVNLAIPADSIFSHTFASGIVFEPETGVWVQVIGGGSIPIHLSGYLMKAK